MTVIVIVIFSDDVCVLSATGTAAIIGFVYVDEAEDSVGNLPVIPKPHVLPKNIMTTSLDRNIEKDKPTTKEEKVDKYSVSVLK